MAIRKKSNNKADEPKEASLEAQERLIEILNDSPHLVSLNGTQYEVRALRMGTQYLIAQEVVNINKIEQANYGDVVKQFSQDIPALVRVIVFCILNDKKRIYKNGLEYNGYSDEFNALYDTIMWEGNIAEYGYLLLECLQLLDVSVFFQALDILSVFKSNVTMKRAKTKEQK